jgi:hypothetical protein
MIKSNTNLKIHKYIYYTYLCMSIYGLFNCTVSNSDCKHQDLLLAALAFDSLSEHSDGICADIHIVMLAQTMKMQGNYLKQCRHT